MPNKKKDSIDVNIIDRPYEDKKVGKRFVGRDGKAPSCIYKHKTYAAGSIIKNRNGSETICSENGTWQNKT